MYWDSELSNMNNSISSRRRIADMLAKNQNYLEATINLILKPEHENSLNAFKALEVLSRDHIALLLPFSDKIIISGKLLQQPAVKRCFLKIIEQLLLVHYSEDSYFMTKEQGEDIIQLCFTWLISDKQIATQVFSMQNLFLLKNEKNWIEEELKHIILNNYASSSAGYQARARKILRKIK